ncbi:MAG: hypothetical protein NTY64_10690 [Deltaproteobacteria bacterium]|nr:hypothetical protein [Deltaproteobacteria bacterium]
MYILLCHPIKRKRVQGAEGPRIQGEKRIQLQATGLKFYGFVKSPSAALPCILRRCGVLPSTPHSSGIVRLASGAFYFAIHSDDFLRDHQISS